MAASMEKKFDKYWGNPEKMNLIMFLGLVLDPRYKLDYVQHCIGVMYGGDKAQQMVVDVKAALKRLCKEYHDIAPPSPPAPNMVPKKLASKTILDNSKNRVKMTNLKEK